VTSANCVTPRVYLPSVHPRTRYDPAPCAEDEGRGKVPDFYVCERGMGQIYLDEVCRVAGLCSTVAPASPQEIRGR
jgi:hypothetical protein